MKTVMAFGSFDILHPGHLLYLERARKLGSRLIVVVARDSSIKMFKGKTPIFNERERLRIVGSLKMVDKAVLGKNISGPEGRFKILQKYRPDVIAIGYDQNVNLKEMRGWLKKKSVHARVIKIRNTVNTEKYKSSIIKKRILSQY